ncbi:hypothetical protein POM88_044596 [Heracleum sosnowskyi]|uniref:RNase H type-1 domain-containing protein n=1 Tax=Heracleum sosnowskyi TaxID=360622 RepID=A0AAD8M5G7_9APIA|nr:hypothetical protein POM88_044596 [Heracleum sosnowskyi]
MLDGFSFMGNIDGSFRSLSKDRYEAGLGGLIRDSKEKIIMQFSGPTLACNAFESEVAALGKLVEIISSSEFSKENFMIFSNNAQLVNLAMSSQEELKAYLPFLIKIPIYAMENVNIRWKMPRKGFVKINVCGYFSDQPLENGNRSGIDVVIRSSRGSILRMYAGSLQIDDRRLNKFYAFLEGMKRAYYADFPRFILEAHHVDVYWEWRHSTIEGAILEHAYIVHQLNQCRGDRNFLKDVRFPDAVDNDLASYLAKYGAAHWTIMVRIKKPFGRVHKLWNHDMRLGPVLPLFEIVNEDDLVPEVVEPEFDPPMVEAMIDEEDAEEVVHMVNDQEVVVGMEYQIVDMAV